MNEKQIAAMRQGLEALEGAIGYTSAPAWSPSMTDECNKAITALTAVLADQALDKMAENERELGIQMQPTGKQHLQVEQPAIKQSLTTEQPAQPESIATWNVDVQYPRSPKPEQPTQQTHCDDCGGFDPECPLAKPAQHEIEELTAQRDKLADILTRTANALKGQPAELSEHSWHDLPEVAQKLKVEQQEPVAGLSFMLTILSRCKAVKYAAFTRMTICKYCRGLRICGKIQNFWSVTYERLRDNTKTRASNPRVAARSHHTFD